MTATSTMPLSRRTLVTGSLASGFLLAFHLPLRGAVNEPVQPPDVTEGKFAPNALNHLCFAVRQPRLRALATGRRFGIYHLLADCPGAPRLVRSTRRGPTAGTFLLSSSVAFLRFTATRHRDRPLGFNATLLASEYEETSGRRA